MPRVSKQVREEYNKILRRSREDDSADSVGNRYPWQCQAAVRELFEAAVLRQALVNAKGTDSVCVRILTATCPEYVYGHEDTRKLMEKFLGLGGTIKVLIWNETFDGTDNTVARLSERNPSRLSIRLSGTSAKGETLHHFCVVENSAFRIEKPHPLRTSDNPPFSDFSPEIPALICFNDPAMGTTIEEFFERLWEHASKSEPEAAAT